jgi:hypothetical protein
VVLESANACKNRKVSFSATFTRPTESFSLALKSSLCTMELGFQSVPKNCPSSRRAYENCIIMSAKTF